MAAQEGAGRADHAGAGRLVGFDEDAELLRGGERAADGAARQFGISRGGRRHDRRPAACVRAGAHGSRRLICLVRHDHETLSCRPQSLNCARKFVSSSLAQRVAWQNASGYNKRVRVEATMNRWKQVIGDELRAHTDERRATEVAVAVHALNLMLELGRPSYVRMA